MNVSELLQSVVNNIGTIESQKDRQTELITQIKEKAESLDDAGAGVEPILYGTYVLKDWLNFSPPDSSIELDLVDQGAYGWCFVPTNNSWDYREINYIIYRNHREQIVCEISFDEEGSFSTYYHPSEETWYANYEDFFEFPNNTGDDRWRIIDFTRPVTTPQTFYDLFMNTIDCEASSSSVIMQEVGLVDGTSDATATRDDLVTGKTAYINGKKISGGLMNWSNTSNEADSVHWDDSDDTVYLKYTTPQGDGFAVKENSSIDLFIDSAAFGNATAANVLSGKTFTSTSGLKISGTIATKTSSNLTASGATVTVPSGYYASQTTKSVNSATQATPSITVSSAGLITASATQTAGYVAAGTKSATKQLTVQAAKTVTPSTSNQTAVASGKYTTGAVTVKGDANLVASNIKSGVSIFGVTGTYTGVGGGAQIVSGRATTDEDGIVTIQLPAFEPQQMMIWNVQHIDQWEETGDDSLVQHLYDGILLCAARADDGHWVSQGLSQSSGTQAIQQTRAEIGPWQGDPGYGTTNIQEDGNSIRWCLPIVPFDSYEGTPVDFTNVNLNYVLIG